MPIGLTITDNANGTGAVASLTGLTDPAKLIIARVDSPFPIVSWLDVDTVANTNTTRAIAVPPAFYWASVVPTVGQPTKPLPFLVTAGGDSYAGQCEAVIVATIRSLNLPEIGQSVFAQLNDNSSEELEFPCVHVCAAGQQESEDAGTNTTDEISYPFIVTIMDHQHPNLSEQREKFRKLRERLVRCFRNLPLLGLDFVKFCKVEYTTITPTGIDSEQFQFYTTGFIIRVACNDPRGIGA